MKILVKDMREALDKVRQENTLLKEQQSGLVSERANLIKKNEYAKEQIEAIIERLRNLEEYE